MSPAPAPSDWVLRHGNLVPPRARVLDLACGSGRHARWFRARGNPVTAVDRDLGAVADLADDEAVELIPADLEAGPWPFADRRFPAVVVVRYLWRPILPKLVAAVAAGGVLIYETFMAGHEKIGKPRNPDHLLQPYELFDAVRDRLAVVAFEQGRVEVPEPAIVQRIVAVHGGFEGVRHLAGRTG